MSAPAPYEMRFYLNTALCQSPPNISKTMKSMNYIKHFAVVSRITAGQIENGCHHMTVILTNNNLSETKQWKLRLLKNLHSLNTIILSSNKASDIKSLDQLFGKMLRCKKADGLPDLLVMCTHEKRTSDLKELIETLKNKTYNFTKFGIHRISLTIMFDEADKNMKQISSCLSDINPLITNGTGNVKYDDVIRDIHFITATPVKTFWAELKKNSITSLHNINTAIAAMDSESSLHTNYAELMKDYRFLEEHTIHMNSNMTDDPIEYAVSILDTLDMKSPRTVFAPSRIYLDDHDLMQQELTRRGFNVYIDNSKKKGFYDLKGDFISIELFNKAHSIKGELYETFVKWRELHPNEHLAITGLLNITRGITFNTIGFNFTDMIISAYHAKDIASLVQLFGRANGGKKYVNVMKLHTPTDVYNKVKEFVDMAIDILNKNPDEFEEKHFRGQTSQEKKRAQQEVAWTVPKVFQLTDEEYGSIKKIKGKSGKDTKEWDKATIMAQVAKKDAELQSIIKGMDCFQVTEPAADNTYKKYITDFIARAEAGTKYIMGLHKDSKKKDGYQVFMDTKNKKMIVSVYYGTRLPKDDSESDDE